MTALTTEEKWKAVVGCDHSYDGRFFYGVKTTGIFCRPSCKSKEPKRSNVEFFDEIKDAYAYGLRPCKRCRPDLKEFCPVLDIIEKIKEIFDAHFADKDRLTAEVKKLGISQNHCIHLFRQQFQMTPVEYMNKLRVEQAKQMLVSTELTIVHIALACGFRSLSTFYECFKKYVGFPPKKYREQSSAHS
ncbi:bifunctional transcriptional activator/DNA repair enzyme AdaA [Pelosinus propionicus]|uniref:Transcriptional regulator, AraC family n=1 Tax=Pelosinus propionicus DSM 13327 TaxID=1123291 RepID=A0A1I4KAS4_9FIRM|nr:Ada metal-binding domain-containing protein [Pelosinus propionicus]SFL75769.1 transcriptional regulator, AraC family [Pelosinus propionicus DSM 13327]